jgi:hypothetical protein
MKEIKDKLINEREDERMNEKWRRKKISYFVILRTRN